MSRFSVVCWCSSVSLTVPHPSQDGPGRHSGSQNFHLQGILSLSGSSYLGGRTSSKFLLLQFLLYFILLNLLLYKSGLVSWEVYILPGKFSLVSFVISCAPRNVFSLSALVFGSTWSSFIKWLCTSVISSFWQEGNSWSHCPDITTFYEGLPNTSCLLWHPGILGQTILRPPCMGSTKIPKENLAFCCSYHLLKIYYVLGIMLSSLHILSLVPNSKPGWDKHHFSRFTDKETESERSHITCPGSHRMASGRLNPSLSNSEAHTPSFASSCSHSANTKH